MEELLDTASQALAALNISAADDSAAQSLPVHLLVCGSTMVGKTALIERFVSDSFNSNYDKTTQTTHLWRTMTVAGRIVAVHVEDSPGAAAGDDNEDLAECVPGPLLYRFASEGTTVTTQLELSDGSHSLLDGDDQQCPAAVIIVFNPSKRETFEQASWLVDHVYRLLVDSPCECAAEHLPMVLVANMTDLPRKFRKPECSAAAGLAKSYSIPFVEASARSPKGVEAVFESAVRRALGCQLCAERCTERQRALGNSPWEQMQALMPEWLAVPKEDLPDWLPLPKAAADSSNKDDDSDDSDEGGEAQETTNTGIAKKQSAHECLLVEKCLLINSRDVEPPDSDDSDEGGCSMSQCEGSVIGITAVRTAAVIESAGAAGGKSTSVGMRRMCHEMAKKKLNDVARAQVLDWRVERTSNQRYSAEQCRGRSDITLSSVGRSVSGIVKDTLYNKQMISPQPPERLIPKMYPQKPVVRAGDGAAAEEAGAEKYCETVKEIVEGAIGEEQYDSQDATDSHEDSDRRQKRQSPR